MRALLFGVAALAVVSSPAVARDGCGRGWFYNGVSCVQEEYRPAPRYYDGPRYYRPEPRVYYDNRVRPTMGANGSISCGNPRFTWQDGACRPYRGP
jgi:hypothetical protein